VGTNHQIVAQVEGHPEPAEFRARELGLPVIDTSALITS